MKASNRFINPLFKMRTKLKQYLHSRRVHYTQTNKHLAEPISHQVGLKNQKQYVSINTTYAENKTMKRDASKFTFYLVSQVFWDFATKCIVILGRNGVYWFFCFIFTAKNKNRQCKKLINLSQRQKGVNNLQVDFFCFPIFFWDPGKLKICSN